MFNPIQLERNPRPDEDEMESERAAFDTIFTRIGVFPPQQEQVQDEEQES